MKIMEWTQKESLILVNSVAATYFGDGEFNIDWHSFSAYKLHYETFEVRYSTSPFENDTNYNNSAIVPGSPAGG
ncbi:MAG: hypothetical protein DRP06_04225 [Candidatus Aenigmatarchaeota archaeon]|nr:MAG: hypothetical protein DRP06_04225 [Candidatus Aenigmarchaeota archaeon]